MDKLQSFLGTQSDLHGSLSSKGILRLDGAVTGTICADQVILSETAYIKGEISAEKIIVGGTVEGILRASDVVEIRSRGKVTGDICTRRFLVMGGGEFNGRIDMTSDAQNILAFASRDHKTNMKA